MYDFYHRHISFLKKRKTTEGNKQFTHCCVNMDKFTQKKNDAHTVKSPKQYVFDERRVDFQSIADQSGISSARAGTTTWSNFLAFFFDDSELDEFMQTKVISDKS